MWAAGFVLIFNFATFFIFFFYEKKEQNIYLCIHVTQETEPIYFQKGFGWLIFSHILNLCFFFLIFFNETTKRV